MRRVAVALLVGIALQGLGAIAFIAWWTREDPDRASVAPSAVETWAAVPADDAAPAEPKAAALTAEAGRATSRARVGPARESVPVTERRAQVSFRRELKVALAALQDRMAECSLPDASFTLDVESVA